jgi:hypothetical protein
MAGILKDKHYKVGMNREKKAGLRLGTAILNYNHRETKEGKCLTRRLAKLFGGLHKLDQLELV